MEIQTCVYLRIR